MSPNAFHFSFMIPSDFCLFKVFFFSFSFSLVEHLWINGTFHSGTTTNYVNGYWMLGYNYAVQCALCIQNQIKTQQQQQNQIHFMDPMRAKQHKCIRFYCISGPKTARKIVNFMSRCLSLFDIWFHRLQWHLIFWMQRVGCLFARFLSIYFWLSSVRLSQNSRRQNRHFPCNTQEMW